MDLVIRFSKSAFRHGATETDIRRAFETSRYDGPIDDDPGKRLRIGFDSKSNPLEIMYNELDDNSIRVFHAMKCRNIYVPLLEPQGEL
jgi:hypothetical protein